MKRILYVGGFILPDKNAAAQRVINNAKAIRKNGNEVIFINYSDSCKSLSPNILYYSGFKCYEYPKRSLLQTVCSVKQIINAIENEKITDVIMYNYPLIGMWRIMKYCKKKDVKCIGDVTEWYVGNHGFIYNVLKKIESNARMRYLNYHLDSMIVISSFLFDYYLKSNVNLIKIPPLVDLSDKKWSLCNKNNDIPTFCFVGNVNKQKERLDYVVKSIETIEKEVNLKFIVVGVSKKEFIEYYDYYPTDDRIIFLGKVNNEEAINILKKSDWTIIIKDVNLVTTAGFPTKVAESITANVPVIANEFSNIFEYLDDTNSIKVKSIRELPKIIMKACNQTMFFDNQIFDYHLYLNEFKKLGL